MELDHAAEGSPHGSRRSRLLAVAALLIASLGTFTASAQADHGQGVGKTEISCNRVTWSYSQFPNAEGNKVKEQIRIQGVRQPVTVFEFNGSGASHTTAIETPEGEYSIDVNAVWDTNGIKGSFDHSAKLDCRPQLTILKEQRLVGEESFTTRSLEGQPGQRVEYRIVVTNTGNRDLTLGELRDPKCSGYATEPRRLAVEQSTEYTCEGVLTEAGRWVNVAEVTGYTEEEQAVNGVSNEVVVNVPARPEFSIVKAQEIQGSAGGFVTTPVIGEVGNVVEYRITVTNTGNTPLRFEPLSDAGCEAGTISGGPGKWLAVAQSATWTCSHTLTPADREHSQYTNTATATAFPPEGFGNGRRHKSNTVVVNFKGHGEGEGGTEITCTQVTFYYLNFPPGPTTVTQRVTAGGTVISLTYFTFAGSTASDTVAISPPAGTKQIDANAHWPGGSFDHHAVVLCE